MNGRKEFSEWLTARIQERGWSFRSFAERAGTTIGTVSRVINQHQDPTAEFCLGAATALDLPPELVFTRAGLLPASTDDSPNAKVALHLFSQLPLDVQDMILAQMRALVEREDPERRRRSVAAQTREASDD